MVGRRFVRLPSFHDYEAVLLWDLEQLDVSNRVAVYEKEVSECAFLDDAEFAGIGIAWTK